MNVDHASSDITPTRLVGRLHTTLLLWIALMIVSCRTPLCRAQEAYDDLINEVLEESEYYQNYHYTMEDEYGNSSNSETLSAEEMHRRAEEEKIRQQEELLRLEEELACERVQQQREEAFEAELRQMSEEKRKAALKQKHKDARIVKRVLRASRRGDHYGVLGLRNLGFRIPPRTIKIMSMEWTIPEFSLFHISSKTIRKAYRGLALAVHPDKNRDGRAEEAFMAVENAASILADEALRAEYDLSIELVRQELNNEVKQVVGKAVHGTLSAVSRTVTIFRTLLGPFAFPVLIIGALLV